MSSESNHRQTPLTQPSSAISKGPLNSALHQTSPLFPPRQRLELVGAGTSDPVRALAVGRALLDEVATGTRGPTLRIYQPSPTAAFGARDRFLPGFANAVQAAQTAGFTPVLRSLGGRVALYHEHCLVVDHVEPIQPGLDRPRERFVRFAKMFCSALQKLGVQARVGEVPGEYCPGQYSVNLDSRIKIIGTAQRVTRSGWLFSSVIVVTNPNPIRSGLTAVQAALGVDWNPSTAGSISQLYPRITVADVRQAVLAEYAHGQSPGWQLVPSLLSADTLNAAAAHEAALR